MEQKQEKYISKEEEISQLETIVDNNEDGEDKPIYESTFATKYKQLLDSLFVGLFSSGIAVTESIRSHQDIITALQDNAIYGIEAGALISGLFFVNKSIQQRKNLRKKGIQNTYEKNKKEKIFSFLSTPIDKSILDISTVLLTEKRMNYDEDEIFFREIEKIDLKETELSDKDINEIYTNIDSRLNLIEILRLIKSLEKKYPDIKDRKKAVYSYIREDSIERSKEIKEMHESVDFLDINFLKKEWRKVDNSIMQKIYSKTDYRERRNIAFNNIELLLEYANKKHINGINIDYVSSNKHFHRIFSIGIMKEYKVPKYIDQIHQEKVMLSPFIDRDSLSNDKIEELENLSYRIYLLYLEDQKCKNDIYIADFIFDKIQTLPVKQKYVFLKEGGHEKIENLANNILHFSKTIGYNKTSNIKSQLKNMDNKEKEEHILSIIKCLSEYENHQKKYELDNSIYTPDTKLLEEILSIGFLTHFEIKKPARKVNDKILQYSLKILKDYSKFMKKNYPDEFKKAIEKAYDNSLIDEKELRRKMAILSIDLNSFSTVLFNISLIIPAILTAK